MKITRSISSLLLLALVGCGSGGDDRAYVYEAEIGESSPAAFSQTSIYHLESPSDAVSAGDSGGPGSDTIYLAGDKTASRMFCLDLDEGTHHRAQIWGDTRPLPISIDSQTPCATLNAPVGKVKISLMHDGASKAEDVFVFEADAANRAWLLARQSGTSDQPGAARASLAPDETSNAAQGAVLKTGAMTAVLLSQEASSAPMTVISATGCPSCDLENADLSHRDLQQMDFSGANLRSANVSYANLTSADLFKADLTELVTEYAVLSRTVWSDGKICAPWSETDCGQFVFTVHANRSWQDTGVVLRNRRGVVVNASGSWTANPARGMVCRWASKRHRQTRVCDGRRKRRGADWAGR